MKVTKYEIIEHPSSNDLVYRAGARSIDDLVAKTVDDLLLNDNVEIIAISHKRNGVAVIYYRE